MIIDKILNNNVIVVKDKNNVEKIIMGKGIAFNKKIGDEIEKKSIEKVFTLTNSVALNKLQELVVDIPLEYLEVTEEIVVYSKACLGKRINEMIYVSLVDHIYTSIDRYLEGINIKNALLWDIRRFYPDEFDIGMTALDMIEKKFKVRLPDDEAGFIALHIVNAEIDEDSMQNMYAITKVMQEISNIVKYKFQIEFDENSVYYYRFITHLKFFAQRLISGKTFEDMDDSSLLDMVKTKYKNAYYCVNEISNFIYRKYEYELSDEEKLYLTIHIERVVYKTKT
ncbi:BglG family transcription antiterminator LicT [Thomasclavelia saccharogumia]|uniref:BglG family transcription antiterminator LicT n=1 Tax=Thomasclavelia saccharogumia TaxID=341225 RepID=UPI0004786A87|nr:PRD domain-containing protein [Thomasclavelia saccharogumia]